MSTNKFVKMETEPSQFTQISWEELLNRPNFKTSISGNIELDNVIGMYTAPKEVKCGLKSCNTPHKKGFVILTSNGVETNIGQVCGKENFQLNFENYSIKIQKSWDSFSSRQRIISFQKELKETHISYFNENLSRTILSPINEQLSQYYTFGKKPEPIYLALKTIRKTKNPAVFISQKLTEEEIQLWEASSQSNSPRPQSKEIQVGSVYFTEVLDYTENNKMGVIIRAIEDTHSSIENLTIDEINELPPSELKRISALINDYSGHVNRLKDIKILADKFLSEQNLVALTKIPLPPPPVLPARLQKKQKGKKKKSKQRNLN